MTLTPVEDFDIENGWTQSQLLSAIVNYSDDAIIGETVEGMVASWNPAAERMYGYSADEIIGRSKAIVCPAGHGDEIEDVIAMIRRGEQVVHRETVRRRKDGSTFAASVTVSPIKNEQGDLVGVSSITRDITEAKQDAVDSGLRQRAEDLKVANLRLERFTYSVAHDLRAPLRALSGFSTVLLEDYGDTLGDEGREYAERIIAASGQMSALIDGLLQLSRVARAEIRPRPVDLGAEAAKVAQDLQQAEPDRRVRFTIEHPEPVRADPTLIRTVLENLLGNAWKFTAGATDASIDFGVAPADGDNACCYYVRDNGAGFDPVYIDKLFQPFQRLHTIAEFPGSGIGLASVAQIVERHGGRVWATGSVGGGATFFFTLDPEEAS